MDAFDAFFSYDAYRPHQRDMLEFAAGCAREGSIAMGTDGLSLNKRLNDLCPDDASMLAMA